MVAVPVKREVDGHAPVATPLEGSVVLLHILPFLGEVTLDHDLEEAVPHHMTDSLVMAILNSVITN